MDSLDNGPEREKLLSEQIGTIRELITQRDTEIVTLNTAINDSKKQAGAINAEAKDERAEMKLRQQECHQESENEQVRLNGKFEQVKGLLGIIEKKSQTMDELVAVISEKRDAIATKKDTIASQEGLLESMNTQMVELVDLVGKQGEGLSYLEKGGDTMGMGMGVGNENTTTDRLTKLKERTLALQTRAGEEAMEETSESVGVCEAQTVTAMRHAGVQIHIQNNLLCTIL